MLRLPRSRFRERVGASTGPRFPRQPQDLGGYKAIDVEHPEKSQLLQRIHDKDDPMPPEDAEKQLNEEERKILSAWVKQGGKYL